ncbi:MAG: ketoacid-CoA transferase [Actinomycetota bacterium]|nr:MAG: ketoacid-CoA transferase [Actinomycetota bacterium]
MTDTTPTDGKTGAGATAGAGATQPAPAYTPREMMAIAAGRFIADGDVLFAGTGVAMLAATVAKRIHAPRAHIFFETGGIGPQLDELPMAVADPRVMAYADLNAGLVEAFSYVANRRLHTIAFLGAAQIDRYGNMNSTVIGDYHHPTVRFSGSGGACDAGSLASGFIVFMQHGTRKFVEKLDYFTTPGWLEGGESRRHAGYRRGGPLAVVTNLCVLRFRADTKAMYLAERFPGVTVEEIVENTGFELDVEGAGVAEPPTAEELRILRDDVDPQRLILG